MKAALYFLLPEEQDDFNCARMGGAYKAALDAMDEYLRKRLKYEDGLDKLLASEVLQAARDELTNLVLDAEE